MQEEELLSNIWNWCMQNVKIDRNSSINDYLILIRQSVRVKVFLLLRWHENILLVMSNTRQWSVYDIGQAISEAISLNKKVRKQGTLQYQGESLKSNSLFALKFKFPIFAMVSNTFQVGELEKSRVIPLFKRWNSIYRSL